MKKFLLSIVFLFGLLVQSNAQHTFAPVGAEWWYFTHKWADYKQLDHAQSIGDTIILGIDCRKLSTQKNYRYSAGAGPIETTTDSILYLYNTTDTVFIYNNIFGKFTPLYVYNVSAGDTVCLPVPPGSTDLRINPNSNDTSFCFIIDSIIMEMYDTSLLKSFYLHPLASFADNQVIGDFPSFTWKSSGAENTNFGGSSKYTEIIGGYQSLLPIHVVYPYYDSFSVTTGPSGFLRCYSDPERSILNLDSSNPPLPCDNFPPESDAAVANVDNFNSHISIYPNPSNGNFTVSLQETFKKNISIDLLDMSGRKICQYLIPAYQNIWQIQNQSLHPGVYTLIFNTEQGKFYKKVVVQ